MAEQFQTLHNQKVNDVISHYGIYLSQTDLADLLHRSVGGLRHSLSNSSDPHWAALRRCCKRIGRRVYYPAHDVVLVLEGDCHD